MEKGTIYSFDVAEGRGKEMTVEVRKNAAGRYVVDACDICVYCEKVVNTMSVAHLFRLRVDGKTYFHGLPYEDNEGDGVEFYEFG